MLSILSSKNKGAGGGGVLRRQRSSAATSQHSLEDADAKTTTLNEALETLSNVFPNIDVDEFRRMLGSLAEESRVHIITEMLLKRSKDGGVPRRKVTAGGGGLEPWERFRTETYQEATRGLL